MRITSIAATAALCASPVFAGGVERSTQSMAILFQEGNYLELGATFARPRISGIGPSRTGGTAETGNIAERFSSLSLGYKGTINDQLSYAIIIDEPIGADVVYPTDTGYILQGATGSISSKAITGVLRYNLGDGFSVHGGLRSVWSKGSVTLPLIPGESPVPPYTMSTNTDQAWGYPLGVAYEMPEIAARVSLTYNSRVRHRFDAEEAFIGVTETSSNFNTTIPESLHLEFQTGIMEDTLLMGSIRWVKWKDFEIHPSLQPSPIVSYDKNSVTYTLGVGRRFNENWSGSISLGYDTGNGTTTGNLQPVSTRRSIGLGASYTQDAMTISGGIQYSRFGSASTRGFDGRFSGNSAIGAGLRVGFSF